MKKVLVAPLDWGLGHATRCIPIIDALLERNCEVVIAGSGRSIALLQLEFPNLTTLSLPAYDPAYSSSGKMVWTMAQQLPKFLKTIRAENNALDKIISTEKIDLVISDNRFGCWSSKVPCVFITHQSNILMPKRFGWLSGLVRRANERTMKKFSYCWIPDFPGEKSLAGTLASWDRIDAKIKVRHIGVLSRFKFSHASQGKAIDLLCILSGPEPQRTRLEEIILHQVESVGSDVTIVRGVPRAENSKPISSSATIVDFATREQLRDLLPRASVVLARSGFSTVMDLAKLRKKAIFVPTPGQTEQLYLAKRLMADRIALAVDQNTFDLKESLATVKSFKGFEGLPEEIDLLSAALDEVLS